MIFSSENYLFYIISNSQNSYLRLLCDCLEIRVSYFCEIEVYTSGVNYFVIKGQDIRVSGFCNGVIRASIFRNECVCDLGTYAVLCLVMGARGVPYFVINGCMILAHKLFHI